MRFMYALMLMVTGLISGFEISNPDMGSFVDTDQFNNKTRVKDFNQIIQPISYTVLYKKDGTGKVDYDKLIKQIDVLNDAFSGTYAKKMGYRQYTDSNIKFKLASVRYVKNDTLFDLCAIPSTIAKYRPMYMTRADIHLNIYICWCQYMLGVSWFPYDSWYGQPLSERHYSLGAIVHHELLPGNNFKGGLWTSGNILVHEVGHSYGLPHPYNEQGFCLDKRTIPDVPVMIGNPLQWCNKLKGRNSCPGQPGKDDMSNYMVATSCTNHFTPGQVVFMQNVIMTYKPTLRMQKLPTCVAAITTEDTSPDLQPCIEGTIKPYSKNKTIKICNTDPVNNSIWAFACCPSNYDFDKDLCRQGIPNFN